VEVGGTPVAVGSGVLVGGTGVFVGSGVSVGVAGAGVSVGSGVAVSVGDDTAVFVGNGDGDGVSVLVLVAVAVEATGVDVAVSVGQAKVTRPPSTVMTGIHEIAPLCAAVPFGSSASHTMHSTSRALQAILLAVMGFPSRVLRDALLGRWVPATYRALTLTSLTR
jgi:hypothetical protein